MSSLHLYTPEFIARVAHKVLPPREDGEQLTYEDFCAYAVKLDFGGKQRLEGALDRLIAEEQASSLAAAEKRRMDPVYSAEEMLANAERALREIGPSAALSQLERQDKLISDIESRRITAKHAPAAWLAVSRELEDARIERERLALLASEYQAQLDSAKARVERARAELEAAKQRQQQNAANQPPPAA